MTMTVNYLAYALCLCWIFLFEFVEYPIVSIEDPFDKEDWEHIKHISSLGICQVLFLDQLMFCFNLCLSLTVAAKD